MDSLAPADAHCMMYVTVASDAEAKTIARVLVGEHLAACTNILGPAASIYRWNDAVEEAQEVVMIVKTLRTHASAAAARIAALHSYDTPCIVTYAMESGAPPYLEWMRGAVHSGA